jgi:hypothetical protein
MPKNLIIILILIIIKKSKNHICFLQESKVFSFLFLKNFWYSDLFYSFWINPFVAKLVAKCFWFFFFIKKRPNWKIEDQSGKKMVGNFKDGIKCSLWSSYFQISYIFVPLVFLKLHFVSKFYFSYFSVLDLRNEREWDL